jgi:hypothetical protein
MCEVDPAAFGLIEELRRAGSIPGAPADTISVVLRYPGDPAGWEGIPPPPMRPRPRYGQLPLHDCRDHGAHTGQRVGASKD